VRIGIDASFIDPGRVGGAEHMVVNLVEGLAASDDPADTVVVFTDHPWAAPDRIRFERPTGPGNRFTRISATLRPQLASFDALLFANYFTPPFPRSKTRPRFLTVIHDLQYLHAPENFSRRKRVWLRTAHEATLRLADSTVAISHDVRRDILARYGTRWGPRVHTIHNPVSWARFGEGEPGEAPPVERPYILAVAAHYPHKNLETLVRAVAELKRRGGHDDVALVLAGQLGRNLSGVAWTRPLDGLIEELGLTDSVHVTGYIDDRQLGVAYRHAAVFAFPSLFEGFALPVVEALGFGLPVLTTRRTAIPEVSLGLATYLDDPMNAVEMAGCLDDMLADPPAFRPGDEGVGKIRAAYAPERIGTAYRALLAGGVEG
jgi:glycosyltransferase involved in cell wall biosynthesis